MTQRFGPGYFEDKDPSEQTAKAAIEAKANGFTIAYPAPFLKKLDPNALEPVAPEAAPEVAGQEQLKTKTTSSKPKK